MRTAGFSMAILAFAASTSAQTLAASQLAQVKQRLADGAVHSWELGTRAQALLELDTPSFSVFTGSLPPATTSAPSSLFEVIDIANTVLAQRTTSGSAVTLWTGDGAAGDPASAGIAVLLAAWTGQSGHGYAGIATSERNYLMDVVPRTSDGAISHRASQVELWSDSVYMVPPFLAYYGLVHNSQTEIDEAYNQIKLYRSYLHDASAGGLWKHILLGTQAGEPGNDEGHWTTGNAWAAAGMLRVLATYRRSSWNSATSGRQTQLIDWINEIHDGAYAHQLSTGLFHNYADDRTTYVEASGATLLAATVYRLASLTGITTYISQAELTRTAILVSGAHIDGDGWLTPVVNPLNYPEPGSQSPEGQAFVIELQAAYSDWAGLS